MALTLTPEDIQAIVDGILNADSSLYTLPGTVGESIYRTRFLTRSIYIDTDAPVGGDGSQGNPFNNVNDAKDFAEENNIREIVASGDIIIPGNIKNMNVRGLGLARINLNGNNVKGSKFYNCSLSGSYIDSIIAENCELEDGFLLRGHFKECELSGTYPIASESHVLLYKCLSGIPGPFYSTILMNDSLPTRVSVLAFNGGLSVGNMDHVDDVITVEIADGTLIFESSCLLGTMVASGGCVFNNNTDPITGINVVDNTYHRDANIISVADAEVTSVDDFKTDLSGIPASVWSHVTRELTATLGLTPEQEAKIDQLLIDVAAVPEGVMDEIA